MAGIESPIAAWHNVPARDDARSPMTTMTELEVPEARDVGTLVASLDIRTRA